MKNIFSKNKEENQIVNYAIIIFFIIALLYVIIVLIKDSIGKPNIYNTNNIKEYILEDNLVKSDYFYTIDSQVANFLEAVDRELYSDIYKLLMEKYNKIYSRSELTDILKNYRENIFKYTDDKLEIDYTGHVINVYALENRKYLVQLDFNNNNFYMIFGSGKDTYNFTIVE